MRVKGPDKRGLEVASAGPHTPATPSTLLREVIVTELGLVKVERGRE